MEIKLSGGKVAQVDAADFEWLSQWKWYASKGKHDKYYACRWTKEAEHGHCGLRTRKYMHREIMGLPSLREDPRIVDHGDDDGLNNRRENLTIVHSQHANMSRSPNWKRKKVEEPCL